MERRYEILGALRVRLASDEIDPGPAKQRAVLALLLLHANRPVPATSIVDAVWADDPPENGVNVVQKHIAGLRRALEPDRSPRSPSRVLTLDDAGYRLHVADGALDTDAFDAAVRRARAASADGDAATAAAGLREALALWRGEPLAGLGGRVFESARRRLDDARGAAWEALAEAELALGHSASLSAELLPVIEEFPAREGLRHARMLALFQQRRQAEALAAYQEARAYLRAEFGVEPGDRLRALHRQILSAEPAAPAPPAAVPVAPPAAFPLAVPPMLSLPPRPPVEPMPVTAVKAVALAVAAICSAGLATAPVIGYLAWRRRSRLNGVIALVYAVLTVLLIVAYMRAPAAGEQELPFSVWDVFILTGLVIPPFFGAGHAALLVSLDRSASVMIQSVAAEALREANRERARQMLTYNPAMARQLGIGRPDLVRWYDDGGLVDVNAVPERLLAQLPGMTPELARGLAVERERRGPFTTLYDLVAREALPPGLAYALVPVLVFGTDAGVPAH